MTKTTDGIAFGDELYLPSLAMADQIATDDNKTVQSELDELKGNTIGIIDFTTKIDLPHNVDFVTPASGSISLKAGVNGEVAIFISERKVAGFVADSSSETAMLIQVAKGQTIKYYNYRGSDNACYFSAYK